MLSRTAIQLHHDLVRLLQLPLTHVATGLAPRELARQAASSRRSAADSPTAVRTAKQLREHEVDDLVARYREIRNLAQVAREYRMSRTTVSKHLTARGIDASRSMKPGKVRRAVEMYTAGESSMVIGKRLGFDSPTVIAALRAEGVPIRRALGR